MTITVQIRNVYGTDTVYPACDKARAFAAIANQKTLTRTTIEQIKALGYKVVVQQTHAAVI